MAKDASGLTDKQRRFADEYLIDLNATAAYKRAGYTGKGNAAESMASQLLRNIKVAKYIQEAMDRRSEKVEISSEQVLSEIGKLAFADIRKVFNENGQLLPIHMLPDEIAASVSSIEVVTSRIPGGEPADIEHTAKIKFWDKRGSLELLGRHLKLFTDKLDVVVTDSLAERLARARKRNGG
ncbi:terminase small subunit [Herbaspirillum sp. ST 5-3]|uniref:terminase small subunit n=1 Tax=Oxalobacteraceae TaxID=75682 RepID=UPI0010A58555|nr:terminase small subunit [Herbaspirillum sp. ST 5-3]